MTATPSVPEREKPAMLERSSARLAAVQALYQIEASQNQPEQVIKDFLIGRVGGLAVTEDADTAQETTHALTTLDSELFIGLVRAVQTRAVEIDDIIKGALSPEWPWDRLEMTLRATLRAGVAELLIRTDIPGGATVSEFIDVAHAFYAGSEPRMVNAVLDRIAKVLGRTEPRGAAQP